LLRIFSMAPTRTYSHPPRSLDVASAALNQPWRGRPPEPALIARVASEFQEMPGLLLTLAQAARLFQLTDEDCRRVFDHLEHERVLEVSSEGRYRLAAE
jgi:hypothetical protein